MTHEFEKSNVIGTRPASDAQPAGQGPTCVICGCLADDLEHKTLKKKLRLKKKA